MKAAVHPQTAQNSTPTSEPTSDALDTQESAAPRSVQRILTMQRTIGNQATQRALGNVIQRMPKSDEVIGVLGKPTMNIGIGPLKKENSTKYKEVLAALTALDAYLSTQLAATGNEIKEQLKELLRKFDAIIEACGDYGEAADNDEDTSKKERYFRSLKVQAQNEKTQAISGLMAAADHPNPNYRPALRATFNAPDPLVMNEGQYQRDVGGGMNTLQQYGTGNNTAYFKQNTAEMDPLSIDQEMQAMFAVDAEKDPVKKAALMKDVQTRQNQADFADQGGISATDTHSANREVASYRLDQLLDGGLIARTQLALRNAGTQSTLGSVQRGATGQSAGDAKITSNAVDKATTGPGAINVQDPNLMRLLSRLQLLDSLAMQLDRHTGNFFLQTDANGNVTKVTGIDNDMSFGTQTGIEKRIKQYSAMSAFVDAEMAVKILRLDAELLRLAMTDLLSAEELNSLNTRLVKLQAHLLVLQMRGELLQPNQWDVAVAQNLFTEQKGYDYTLAQKAENPARGY